MTNEEGHRRLWGRLAKTGGGNKGIAFSKEFKGEDVGIPAFYCFACEEAGLICDLCPIDWIDWGNIKGLYSCEDIYSPYMGWANASLNYDKEAAKHYAAIIRDLPWKSKVEGV